MNLNSVRSPFVCWFSSRACDAGVSRNEEEEEEREEDEDEIQVRRGGGKEMIRWRTMMRWRRTWD